MPPANVLFAITDTFLIQTLNFNQKYVMAIMSCWKKLWVLMKFQLFLWKEMTVEFIFETWVNIKP